MARGISRVAYMKREGEPHVPLPHLAMRFGANPWRTEASASRHLSPNLKSEQSTVPARSGAGQKLGPSQSWPRRIRDEAQILGYSTTMGVVGGLNAVTDGFPGR